jgi:hypothetical protein
LPETFATIDWVVAPLLHRYVAPASELAVNVTEPPLQNVNGPLAVMVAVGKAETVVVIEAVAVQPFAAVPVTVYVPADVTVLVGVVAPLFQR